MPQNLLSAAVVIGALRVKLLLEDGSTKHSFQKHKNMTLMVNPTKKRGGGGREKNSENAKLQDFGPYICVLPRNFIGWIKCPMS